MLWSMINIIKIFAVTNLSLDVLNFFKHCILVANMVN